MVDVLDPATVGLLLSGALTIGSAVLLLVADARSTLHRIFALLLTYSGASVFIGVIRKELGPAFVDYTVRILPYLVFPAVPLTLLFLCYFPRPRGIGKWRHTPLAVAMLTMGLFLWYAADHSFYGTVAAAGPGQLETAGDGKAFVGFGPFFLLSNLRLVVAGVLSFVLARDYWKAPLGSAGYSRFLVYAGFSLNALFTGTKAVMDLLYVVSESQDLTDLWPYGWSSVGLPLLNLPLAFASFVYIHRASRGEGEMPSLQEPRRFLYFVTPLPVLSAAALTYQGLADVLGPGLDFVLGIWRLSIPVLITYALMRFQFFGADLAVKASVKRIIVLSVFTLLFFVLLEAAESLLAGDLTVVASIAVAALLALVVAPLQRLATRAADRIMPDTRSILRQSPKERGLLYVAQFELVTQDGELSAKDRMVLDGLALSLGLTAEDAEALERGDDPGLPDVVPEPEPERPVRRWVRFTSVAAVALAFGGISQGIESILPAGSFGFGLVGAAFVTLAVDPVQGMLDGLTASRAEKHERRHHLATYQDAVRAAMVDGLMTEEERRFLERLRGELGIGRVERFRVHRDVARRVRRRARVL